MTTWSLNGTTLSYTAESGSDVAFTLNVTGISASNSETFIGKVDVDDTAHTVTLNEVVDGIGNITLGGDSAQEYTLVVTSVAPGNNGAAAWSYNSTTSTATYGQPKTAGYTLSGNKTAT